MLRTNKQYEQQLIESPRHFINICWAPQSQPQALNVILIIQLLITFFFLLFTFK